MRAAWPVIGKVGSLLRQPWGQAAVSISDSMLRLLADNFELVARDYEHGIEALTSAVEQQNRDARQDREARQAAQ
jgi:hypothetical protein